MRVILKNDEVNEVLRKMWDLNNRMACGENMNAADYEYYNKHLSDIQGYYKLNADYWLSQTKK